MNKDDRNPVAQFFGWLLMGVGALIALTTGACTAYLLTTAVFGSVNSMYFGGLASWIVMVLAIGGLPCAIGVGLFFVGRAISRPRARRRPGGVPADRGPLE
jgi:phosphate/sulfate permease